MTDKERLKKYWDEENLEACFLGINVQSLYRKNPDAPVSELKRQLERWEAAREKRNQLYRKVEAREAAEIRKNYESVDIG